MYFLYGGFTSYPSSLQWSPVSQNWYFPFLLDQSVRQAFLVDSRGQRPLWSYTNEGFSFENPL